MARTAPALALSLLAASSPAFADTATRVADLAPGDDDGVSGLDAAVLGDFLYFVGDDGSGEGLYRYDGANPPTLVPGTIAARPKELVVFQDRLYFQGGPNGDRELWEYDPAAPSLGEAFDVRPSGNGGPQRFAVSADELCFGAFTDTVGFELHCWDGSGAPTVFDLALGPDGSYPDDLTAWSGGIAFVNQAVDVHFLMNYDGAGPPQPVAAGPGEPFGEPCCLAAAGGALYFQAPDQDEMYRVYRYAPPSAPARVSATFEPYGDLGAFRGLLVTDGIDPAVGVEDPELFRRVGSALRRVDPGAFVSGSSGHVQNDSALYFAGYPTVSSDDRVLYKYCGAGPVAPAISAWTGGAATVTSERPVAWNGTVFVSAVDALFGEELWAVSPSHLFCDDFETGGLSAWP